MKLLLSCVFAISMFVSPSNESECKIVKNVSTKSAAFKRGSIANTKISYHIASVNRGRYAKIEFINDYDYPVLLEGIVDGVLIEGKKDYKIRIKPNSRKSFLIRYIEMQRFPATCSSWVLDSNCIDSKREVLLNYNRYDTSLIHVFNHKLEIIEDKNKKQLEGKVGRTILR
ncbi:hypothetical protein ACOSP6_15030 [Tenacibaculum sp. MEBiC06402]|uniref:hypothetical protein n=1 Tax=unclassified Tenacibaculum TaxID=2635139 RepID=UPI003B98FC0B